MVFGGSFPTGFFAKVFFNRPAVFEHDETLVKKISRALTLSLLIELAY